MKLVVGLGNPGSRYEKTRHNLGFMVIDELAREWGFSGEKKQGQSLVIQGYWQGRKYLLAKPQTYMNKSGEAVLEIVNFFREGIEDLIILHDDLDLEFGRIRFKTGGGTGGHNGLKSINHLLNSPDYDRLKLGIGRPPQYMKVENYVLSEFTSQEQKMLPEVIKLAASALKVWGQEGIGKAMNSFNGIYLAPIKEE